MRPKHTQHPLPSFPVYSCAFLSSNEMVLGGGGGASRSGIKNKLRLYNIGEDRIIELKDEYELEKGEDAPMSMASHSESKTIVCGVNSVEEKLLKGENENCRTFSIADSKIQLLQTTNTLNMSDVEDFQKVTTISPDGTLLAVAGSHDLSLLAFPSLQPITETIHTDKEIYDVSFSSKSVVVTTTHKLLVYTLPASTSSTSAVTSSPKKSKKKSKPATNGQSEKLHTLELSNTVELPSVTGEGSTFRAGRYHPQNEQLFYTVINVVPPRSRKTKSASRKAYVCKWNAHTWALEKSRSVGDGSITCLDLSLDGRFLAFGSSDLSIGMLDAKTLSPLASILKAHEFPMTVLKFNPSSSLLVSGSPDNSIRVVSIPHTIAGSSSGFFAFVLLAIIVLILALVARQYPGALPW